MRVLLTGDMSGTRNGQEWPPRGSTIDLPDDEAAALCHSGMARPVPTDEVERAVIADYEAETRSPLTTAAMAPPKRGPGRPRKNP